MHQAIRRRLRKQNWSRAAWPASPSPNRQDPNGAPRYCERAARRKLDYPCSGLCGERTWPFRGRMDPKLPVACGMELENFIEVTDAGEIILMAVAASQSSRIRGSSCIFRDRFSALD